MAEIKSNLVYLTENLTRLSEILVHLIQEGLISTNQRDYIKKGETSFDCNGRLLDLIHIDWRNKRSIFLEILRKTGNGHCAEKIEDSDIFEYDPEDTKIGNAGKKKEKDLPNEENANLLELKERSLERNDTTWGVKNKIVNTSRENGNSQISKCNRRITARIIIPILIIAVIATVVVFGIKFSKNKEPNDLSDEETLRALLISKKSDKAVQLARVVHEKTNTDTSLYNLAICLEYNDEHVEATSILQELFAKRMGEEKEKNPDNRTDVHIVNAAKIEMEILEEIYKSMKFDLEPLELEKSPTEMEIRLFLLNLYLREGKHEDALNIVKRTASANEILKTLGFYHKVLFPPYVLKVAEDEIVLQWNSEENQIAIENFTLDLSILPQSVQNLSLSMGTKFTTTGVIDLPNLKHLYLADILSSCLHYFLGTDSLSNLYLYDTGALDVYLVPETVKNIKISNLHNKSFAFGYVGFKKLNKLTLDLFSWSEVEQLLGHFQANQLCIYNYGNPYTPFQVLQMMKKEIKRVAVGKVDWGSEDFQNSDLYEHLNGKSDYYLLEGGKGWAIGKEEFEELCQL